MFGTRTQTSIPSTWPGCLPIRSFPHTSVPSLASFCQPPLSSLAVIEASEKDPRAFFFKSTYFMLYTYPLKKISYYENYLSVICGLKYLDISSDVQAPSYIKTSYLVLRPVQGLARFSEMVSLPQ